MGLAIALEDERGERIETVIDPTNLLHHLLLPYQGKESLLGQIDWYGNTVFNRIQMPLFLPAWRTLTRGTRTSAELALLEQVMLLAKRCEDDVPLYIKFIGD